MPYSVWYYNAGNRPKYICNGNKKEQLVFNASFVGGKVDTYKLTPQKKGDLYYLAYDGAYLRNSGGTAFKYCTKTSDLPPSSMEQRGADGNWTGMADTNGETYYA